MRCHAAHRTRSDGMISPQNQREPAFLERLFDRRAKILACIGDLFHILCALFAKGHFFRLPHGNVADVFDLIAKLLDAPCNPATRRAEGPMSTPRRLAPRSMGTPMMRILSGMHVTCVQSVEQGFIAPKTSDGKLLRLRGRTPARAAV